jgi:DNA-binding NtrC family response regulator
MKELQGISILVVDDEIDLREILEEMLTLAGAEVATAESGTAAFEVLKQRFFQVVISDMKMSHGNGLELVKNICREISPAPKLFLCSGFADLSPEVMKENNIIDIFEKPFDIKKMIRAILKVAGKPPQESLIE